MFYFFLFFLFFAKFLNLRKLYFRWSYLYSFTSSFLDKNLFRGLGAKTFSLSNTMFNYRFLKNFFYFRSRVPAIILISESFVFFIFVQIRFAIDKSFCISSEHFIFRCFYNFYNSKFSFF